MKLIFCSFLAGVVSFTVVYLITPVIRALAIKLSAIDRKNHRKIHNKIVTKLGGLGIYCGFFAGILTMLFLDIQICRSHLQEILGVTICGTLMLVLGVYDDLNGSSATLKFFVQTVISFLLIQSGFVLDTIFIPGWIDLKLGIMSIPVTLLWILGITNAINLIDGLDGLASGLIAIVSIFFALFGVILGDGFVVFLALSLFGANLGFLKYNFHPAKIFMGDTGSLLLGSIIGILAIYQPKSTPIQNPFFFPAVIVLLLPIMDTVYAVIRRTVRGQHIFGSDSAHIHHYYIKLGYDQIQTVRRFYAMTTALGMVTLLIIATYSVYLVR